MEVCRDKVKSETTHICLRVQNGDGKSFKFKTTRGHKFRQIFAKLAGRFNLKEDSCRWTFDGNIIFPD